MRLLTRVLASVAEYELELKNDRQAARIAAAREAVEKGNFDTLSLEAGDD